MTDNGWHAGDSNPSYDGAANPIEWSALNTESSAGVSLTFLFPAFHYCTDFANIERFLSPTITDLYRSPTHCHWEHCPYLSLSIASHTLGYYPRIAGARTIIECLGTSSARPSMTGDTRQIRSRWPRAARAPLNPTNTIDGYLLDSDRAYCMYVVLPRMHDRAK